MHLHQGPWVPGSAVLHVFTWVQQKRPPHWALVPTPRPLPEALQLLPCPHLPTSHFSQPLLPSQKRLLEDSEALESEGHGAGVGEDSGG